MVRYLHDRNGTLDVIKSMIDLDIFKDATVLDIGCNEGFFCRWAADCGAKEVVGLEPKKDRYDWAVKRYAEHKTIKLFNEPYYKYLNSENVLKQFDVVLCLNITHHVGGAKERLDFARHVVNKTCKRWAIFEVLEDDLGRMMRIFMDWKIKKTPYRPGPGAGLYAQRYALVKDVLS